MKSWCPWAKVAGLRQKNWPQSLTHWGQVMQICISKFTIIGSGNGLSPAWHQAIIWTNAGILLIRPLGTKFSEIFIKIHTFSVKKMKHLESSKTVRFSWIELITKPKPFIWQTVNAHSWTLNNWETDWWFRFHFDDCYFFNAYSWTLNNWETDL